FVLEADPPLMELLSFPTRRSSDLPAMKPLRFAWVGFHTEGGPAFEALMQAGAPIHGVSVITPWIGAPACIRASNAGPPSVWNPTQAKRSGFIAGRSEERRVGKDSSSMSGGSASRT